MSTQLELTPKGDKLRSRWERLSSRGKDVSGEVFILMEVGRRQPVPWDKFVEEMVEEFSYDEGYVRGRVTDWYLRGYID